MFGIAVASLSQVSDEEKERYQGLYCGLCLTLKERYGQVPRLALSYDLTFLAILMGSLHESPELTCEKPCVSHPVRGVRAITNPSTAYAADLSVALAYHKCLDDIADDGTLTAQGGRALLERPYAKARKRIPQECTAIEESLARISSIESTPDAPPDDAAEEFGWLLEQLFAHDSGIWAQAMERLGNATGRLVYLMDAAVDLPRDEETGSYNPLAGRGLGPDELRTMLAGVALDMAEAFRSLPLERDAHLMESVIYAGIWQKFNRVYSKAP